LKTPSAKRAKGSPADHIAESIVSITESLAGVTSLMEAIRQGSEEQGGIAQGDALHLRSA
jgi:hypothetical protein